MKKPSGHWSNLLVWTLVHLARCAPQKHECKDPNFPPVISTGDTGQYCEETLNSMNFSLGPRKNVEDDTTLNGTIKRLSGWNEYEQSLGTLDRCPNNVCEPSQLQSLNLTKNIRDIKSGIDKVSHYWPAIQIEFTVPKPSVKKDYFTKAIKLTFSSDRKDHMGDPSFDEKHRLFDFPTYKYTSPDRDDTKPKRILRFPCFMGFHHKPCPTDDYKVYSLTLTSFSRGMTNPNLTVYTELTYNITVYGYHVYHPDPSVWKSTIAVTLYPGNNNVEIVFDPAPDSLDVAKYNVSLVDVYTNATKRYNIMKKDDPHRLCFEKTEDGVYYISVVALTDHSTDGKHTKSHIFTVGHPERIGIKGAIVQSELSTSALHVYLSVGTGVCLALTLLGVLCYYRWRNHTKPGKSELPSFPKVLLIYSNINETNSNLAETVARTCSRSLRMNIIYDKLSNEIEEIENSGYLSWYTEKLNESSAAIILWTPGSDVKPEKKGNTYNEFNIAVTKALNFKTNDDKKLCCVYFDISHKKTIPVDIQKETRVFQFPEKTSQMFSFLHGHKRLKFKAISVDPSLKEEIAELQRNNIVSKSTVTILKDEMDDGLNQQDDITEEEIEELKRKVFQSENSYSGSSSTSNGENITFNPRCPIHGEVFVEKKTNLPINVRSKQYYPYSVSRAPVRMETCPHRHVSSYTGRSLELEECLSCCDSRDCNNSFFRDKFEHVHHPPRNIPFSVLDRNREGRIEIPRNIFSNSYPPGRLPKHDIEYEEENDDFLTSESSFSKPVDGRERSENSLLSDNNSFDDDDTEETPLTSPKFYLEEEDTFIQYTAEKVLKKSNSIDSIESKNSNYSDYSKRSVSISSFELKQSFQKFI